MIQSDVVDELPTGDLLEPAFFEGEGGLALDVPTSSDVLDMPAVPASLDVPSSLDVLVVLASLDDHENDPELDWHGPE